MIKKDGCFAGDAEGKYNTRLEPEGVVGWFRVGSGLLREGRGRISFWGDVPFMLFSNERGRWREGDRSNDEEAKGNLKRTREQKLVYLLIARGHEQLGMRHSQTPSSITLVNTGPRALTGSAEQKPPNHQSAVDTRSININAVSFG